MGFPSCVVREKSGRQLYTGSDAADRCGRFRKKTSPSRMDKAIPKMAHDLDIFVGAARAIVRLSFTQNPTLAFVWPIQGRS